MTIVYFSATQAMRFEASLRNLSEKQSLVRRKNYAQMSAEFSSCF